MHGEDCIHECNAGWTWGCEGSVKANYHGGSDIWDTRKYPGTCLGHGQHCDATFGAKGEWKSDSARGKTHPAERFSDYTAFMYMGRVVELGSTE